MEADTNLGQHFMVDTEVLATIIQTARILPLERVLEIGPGPGALTQLIENKTSRSLSVEIDPRFAATHHANILDVIEDLSFDSVVSNLPYHICEPLFIKLLKKVPQRITVVVGDTFAKHLQSDTILGTIFRELYDIEYVQAIAPESFDPPPKVQSALITCLRKQLKGSLTDFYAYPKSKVKNYLKTKTTKRDAQEFINKLPLPLIEKRLYELSREEFLTMAAVVREMKQ